jgi:hypothetical protein
MSATSALKAFTSVRKAAISPSDDEGAADRTGLLLQADNRMASATANGLQTRDEIMGGSV